MRFLSLLSFCVLVVFGTACERHPLPGDPDPGVHEEHSEAAHPAEKHDEKAPEHTEAAKPAEGAKAEEAPKFFPEKK